MPSDAATSPPTPQTAPDVKTLADAIRVLAMDAVEAANSGHPGMPMGMADVATVLWSKHLKFDAADPTWPDRDRFVLSNGHGSMLQYALLCLTGVQGVTLDALRSFRQWGLDHARASRVRPYAGRGDHHRAARPGHRHCGRHGHGRASLNARFGDELVDHRTWVVCGDGDLMEGVSQEAISLAGRLKLSRLCVLWDDNDITIDGPAALSETGDQLMRFRAAGWMTRRIDGHDTAAIDRTLRWAQRQSRPVLIACKTKIGKGSATLEGHHDTHGKALGPAEVAATRDKLGWPHEPFVMPDAVMAAWRNIGHRGSGARKRWTQRLKGLPTGPEFSRAVSGDIPAEAFARLDLHIARAAADRPRHGHPRGVGRGAEGAGPGGRGADGRLRRSDGLQQHLRQGNGDLRCAGLCGELRQLRYPRARDGCGHERHGAAWGSDPLRRHVLGLHRLQRPAIRLAALMGVR